MILASGSLPSCFCALLCNDYSSKPPQIEPFLITQQCPRFPCFSVFVQPDPAIDPKTFSLLPSFYCSNSRAMQSHDWIDSGEGEQTDRRRPWHNQKAISTFLALLRLPRAEKNHKYNLPCFLATEEEVFRDVPNVSKEKSFSQSQTLVSWLFLIGCREGRKRKKSSAAFFLLS